MKILLASENQGKVSEISCYLKTLNIECASQKDFGFQSEPEVGCTFLENALKKARFACRCSGLPTLADDSGLIVPRLHGAPGVRSARFAGKNSDDVQNMTKLLRLMEALVGEDRRAFFVCVMVFLKDEDDPLPIVSSGIWKGLITKVQKGEHGFGYDPVFFDPLVGKTAGELTQEEKIIVSHRGKALQEMVEKFKDFVCCE